MNSIKSCFKRTTFFVLISILAFSCNKDDAPTQEPKTGYFAKTIKVTDEEGGLFYDITFGYDHNNRLIEETFVEDNGDSTTITYGYNANGQLTEYKENGNLLYRFEYEGSLIVKRIEYNTETGTMLEELPVSFSDGIYNVDNRFICKIDDNAQFLELPDLNVIFAYGVENGVHANLRLSPTRYLVDEFRGSEMYMYDLILSNKEFKGWIKEDEDENFNIENTRNEEGLIVEAVGSREFSGEVELEIIWQMQYEERPLVD